MDNILLQKLERLEALMIGQKNVLKLDENSSQTDFYHNNQYKPTPKVPLSIDLERYNELIPNGAERVMVLVEKEQKYCHEFNLLILESENRINSRVFTSMVLGQISALIALVSLISLSAYAFSLGYDKSAYYIVDCMIGIVGLFITGKYLFTKKKGNSN